MCLALCLDVYITCYTQFNFYKKEFQKFLETTDNNDKNQHEIAHIKARELRNDRYFNSARTK